MEESTEIRGTILVVDDTPASVGMLQSALEQENYEVLIATSGEKALERVSLIVPDLILLDIMMPGMDGYETCLRLKSNSATRNIPIIYLSALSETFDKVRAFSTGGVDYLTKPVEPEELLIRVKTHIRINHLEKALQKSNTVLETRVKERTIELMQANASLREQEELFRGIFESSPIGIILLDKDGEVIVVNKAIVEMYGLIDQSSLVGVNLFHDPNYHQGFLHSVRNRELVEAEDLYDFSRIHSTQLFRTKKNGSMYYSIIVSGLHAVSKEEISGYLMLIQDITDKKRFERIATI